MSIISIGEILWDVFEDARHIGGAPFNLAVQASRLESRVAFVSAVGNDDLGREALQYVAEQGLDTRALGGQRAADVVGGEHHQRRSALAFAELGNGHSLFWGRHEMASFLSPPPSAVEGLVSL